MASTGARRTHVRLAATLLASLLVAFAMLTYLSYTAAFSPVDTITVTAPRAGLEMDRGGKVKYRGIQIGKVDNISYTNDQAQLTLAIDNGELHYIPANAAVHIASNTIFGAKSVEFIPPATPLATSLSPGAHLAASAVSLEVNTLFQSLTDLLHKIDPVELNGTISALAEGLRGHGNDLGALLSGLNTLTQQTNPKLLALQQDFRKTAAVANIYADAAPDLVTVFNNTPSIARTVVDQQSNLNRSLLAAIGLSNNAYDTLAPAEQDLISRLLARISIGENAAYPGMPVPQHKTLADLLEDALARRQRAFHVRLGPFKVTLAGRLFSILPNRRPLFLSDNEIDQRMLGSDHHVSSAVKCVRARGEYLDNLRLEVRNLKFNQRAFAATDPITLK